MVAGHLQKKKGYWYIVLNLHDEDGKRKTKWIATHLPMQGNRRRAEGLLLQVGIVPLQICRPQCLQRGLSLPKIGADTFLDHIFVILVCSW